MPSTSSSLKTCLKALLTFLLALQATARVTLVRISGDAVIPAGQTRTYTVTVIGNTESNSVFYFAQIAVDGETAVRRFRRARAAGGAYFDTFTFDVTARSDFLLSFNGQTYSAESQFRVFAVEGGGFRKGRITISTGPATGGVGDPHLTTFSGHPYDFHGECDLVLLSNPKFHYGAGMDIHVRTKIINSWSYIKNAVLRIGDERLEVKGGRNSKNDLWQYFVNGEAGTELPHKIAEFPLQYHEPEDGIHHYSVDLLDGSHIVMVTHGPYVDVRLQFPAAESFAGTVGLMGTFETGDMAARNGTIIEDPNAFGNEWQVLETEPMLFHQAEGPQAPEGCLMPHDVEDHRRLATGGITKKEAQKACKMAHNVDRQLCVQDVMSTNDMEIAKMYEF